MEKLKNGARRLLALILAAFFITSAAPAGAIDLQNLKNQQNKISQKLQEVKSALRKVDSQRKDVLMELDAIEKDLQETQKKLAITEADLKQTQQKLAVTQQELNKAEQEVENQKENLRVRLKAMYIAGPVDYLEVMLAATSFSDFLTRMDMVKRVADYDKNLLADFKAKKDLIAKKKAELEAHKRAIAQQHQIISTHRARIASRQQDRQKLLASLEEQRKEYERQQDQLEAESRKIAEMIKQIQAKNNRGYMGTGKFHWPAPSSTRVTSNYGWRTHPIFKTKRFHTGVDIGASMGANVVAADDGVVIYAGYYGGYGYTVIVDHGGGISTLYAHLSKILVSEGQKVKRGERVALVGSSGYSTGPHLHFEVRKNGQHVNPWNWLK
ncbi:murein hydrolase activator EnvC family protein [Thermosediminibacter litoriperuensis]|uniref:Septal ring factor EnvC (AmiA/AmiB activator) n=1 Tax=Thermosediminibacter litoriperuensis TaxID=291989 RepID=A0A5S5AWQ7_9FIRM|nr:M23 family metallopeptidase [Thermosediminibacter litoriperuensis]TYP57795.1 septal ring factor EnvC (AmiA/AmiB activator) [Thermosediminibacter litoriperuensis]